MCFLNRYIHQLSNACPVLKVLPYMILFFCLILSDFWVPPAFYSQKRLAVLNQAKLCPYEFESSVNTQLLIQPDVFCIWVQMNNLPLICWTDYRPSRHEQLTILIRGAMLITNLGTHEVNAAPLESCGKKRLHSRGS